MKGIKQAAESTLIFNAMIGVVFYPIEKEEGVIAAYNAILSFLNNVEINRADPMAAGAAMLGGKYLSKDFEEFKKNYMTILVNIDKFLGLEEDQELAKISVVYMLFAMLSYYLGDKTINETTQKAIDINDKIKPKSKDIPEE